MSAVDDVGESRVALEVSVEVECACAGVPAWRVIEDERVDDHAHEADGFPDECAWSAVRHDFVGCEQWVGGDCDPTEGGLGFHDAGHGVFLPGVFLFFVFLCCVCVVVLSCR